MSDGIKKEDGIARPNAYIIVDIIRVNCALKLGKLGANEIGFRRVQFSRAPTKVNKKNKMKKENKGQNTPYLFWGKYCFAPQTRNKFTAWKVDTRGLSRKQATARRKAAYFEWQIWRGLYGMIEEETDKENNPNVRKKKSYCANKLRQ